ncbi:hypothetical protein CEP54_010899 [Fusarium duplospermum]|uniref:Uncharacterized protein n=1 Tax=Fusarium duplospermum TaxID=1325734 RepID=A0A428PHH2_9HYPO|nr:hypothetical protein CEP54_010899 [Fusarium duplospermum]
MGKDFHKRVSDLESRLTSIREDCETCSSSTQNDQVTRQRNLARATGDAMSTLKALIQHLGNSQPSSSTDEALQEMKSAWSDVDFCVEACCRCARDHRDSLLSHGDDLRKWSKEAKLVEAELHLSLCAAQNDVASETASLQRYHEDMEVAKSVVDQTNRDHMEVQGKYFEVREWAAFLPTTWDFQQKLQIALEARRRSLKQAEANLEKINMRVTKAETKLDGHKSRLETLSAQAQKVAGIQAKGHALSRRYKAIAEDAADISRVMNSLKSSYREAVDLVNMINIRMHKLENAEYLLGIIYAALHDSTRVNELAEIIYYMDYRFDSTGRVHSLTTSKHPFGLLHDVQKKLQSQQLRLESTRAFDMYPIRDVNNKSLAALNVDMMRSVMVFLDRDAHRPVHVSPCRIGRSELVDMLRHNIRMNWGDILAGDY